MSDIDELDRRAEEVANHTKFSSDSEAGSSAKSEETNESWAQEAAVTPQDAENYVRNKSIRGARVNFNHSKPCIDEDKDAALDANWSDLEDERKFLENDHKTKFLDLLHRFEHELPEDGDVVDVFTERVVESRGHLNALKPVGPLLFSVEPEDEDESESDESNEQENENDDDNDINMLVSCCYEQAPVLDNIIEELR